MKFSDLEENLKQIESEILPHEKERIESLEYVLEQFMIKYVNKFGVISTSKLSKELLKDLPLQVSLQTNSLVVDIEVETTKERVNIRYDLGSNPDVLCKIYKFSLSEDCDANIILERTVVYHEEYSVICLMLKNPYYYNIEIDKDSVLHDQYLELSNKEKEAVMMVYTEIEKTPLQELKNITNLIYDIYTQNNQKIRAIFQDLDLLNNKLNPKKDKKLNYDIR